MRAASGRAAPAPRVIARTSRRVDIAKALVMARRSRIKVNSALIACGTGLVVAEAAAAAQDVSGTAAGRISVNKLLNALLRPGDQGKRRLWRPRHRGRS